MDSSDLNKFDTVTFKERQQLLKQAYPSLNDSLLTGGLVVESADTLGENCIGQLALPLYLATGFIINGRDYNIPMALEDPTVVGMTKSISQLVRKFGGFKATSTRPIMIGQIQIFDVSLMDAAQRLNKKKSQLVQNINLQYCSSMVERGGGVIDIQVKQTHPKFVTAELLIDVQESMGSNLVNMI